MNHTSKYSTAVILVLFSVTLLFSQDLSESVNGKSDSLLNLLSSAADTQKVKLLNQLSKEMEFRDPEESLKFAIEAVSLSKQLAYDRGLAAGYMQVGNYYTEQSNYKTALDYFEKAWAVYIKLGDLSGEKNIINNIGNVHRYIGDYDKALEYFLKALQMSEEQEDKKGIAYALNNIGILYAIQEKYEIVLEYFLKTLAISEELGDKTGIAYSLNNIGLVYEELEEYDNALEYHSKSLKIKEEVGNKNGVSSSLKNIGNIYLHLREKEKALENHLKALEIAEEIGNTNGVIQSSLDISNIYLEAENFDRALFYLTQALNLSKEINAKRLKLESYEKLSKLYELKNDIRKAYKYHKLLTQIKDSIFNETSSKQMAELQTKYETEKKEAEIKLLKNEKTISNLELDQLKSFRIYLTIVLSLLVILAVMLYSAYRLKKKANLLLEEKNILDVADRARVLNLFGQQVSQEIVDELLTESSETKSKRKFVCIMFLDIRDFTPLMEGKQPEEIIAYQNDVFGFMIEIINKRFGIINQFLGDGYMATFGAPLSSGYDCVNAVKAALEIISTINEKSAAGEIPVTRIGIGLHAGDVVTGNVGTSIRKQYSITGNTVILASRLEKLNKTYNSQLLISEEVLNRIDRDKLEFESLGEVIVKGREKPLTIFKLA